jgi:hypothetical protein
VAKRLERARNGSAEFAGNLPVAFEAEAIVDICIIEEVRTACDVGMVEADRTLTDARLASH